MNAPNKNLYQKLCKLIPNLTEHLKAGKEHGTSTLEGLLDLSYEFQHEDNPGEYIIALAHYADIGGDRVPDPSMDIRVIPENETAQALSFHNKSLYQFVGHTDLNEKLQREFNEFLDQWLDTALAQGHRIDLTARRFMSHEEEIDYLREKHDEREVDRER